MNYRLYNLWSMNLSIPRAWYYAGKSSTFSAQPRLVSLPGRDVVLYRGQSQKLYAVQSRCAHMASPLEKGKVRGENLQCSLHQWMYNSQGICTSIPGARSAEIPRFACLDTFSVAEFHGHIFVHTAPGLGRTLPFFPRLAPEDIECARLRDLQGFTHWSVAAANAFDLAHFEYIHHRRPTQAPRMELVHPEAMALELHYEIAGTSFADRWLVRRYGKQAQLNYTVWNGNLILAETKVGAFVNRMLICVHPESHGFSAKLLVCTPRSRSPLRHLGREMTAHFSKRFFEQECVELKGISINPQRLGPHDTLVAQYMEWLAQMSRENSLASPGTLTTTCASTPTNKPATMSIT